jgi:hypothetical protein
VKRLRWWVEDVAQGMIWHVDRHIRPHVVVARWVRTVTYAEEPGVEEQEVVFEEEISRHWTATPVGAVRRAMAARPDAVISVVDRRRSNW